MAHFPGYLFMIVTELTCGKKQVLIIKIGIACLPRGKLDREGTSALWMNSHL